MDEASAAEQAARVRSRVRAKARWDGWVWLVVGLATPAFLIGVQVDAAAAGQLSLIVAVAFGVLGLTLWALEARRPVTGRAATRVDRPATWAYAATVVAVSVVTIVTDPVGPPGWYVAVALVPALPAVAAAVIVLRT